MGPAGLSSQAISRYIFDIWMDCLCLYCFPCLLDSVHCPTPYLEGLVKQRYWWDCFWCCWKIGIEKTFSTVMMTTPFSYVETKLILTVLVCDCVSDSSINFYLDKKRDGDTVYSSLPASLLLLPRRVKTSIGRW